ncbi:MAG: hypothetical protein ABSH32_17860 [Bryobacteraceae bacterium]|jgi:hypothetical protein
MPNRLIAAAWVTLFALPAFGQDSINTTSSGGEFKGSAHFGSAPRAGTPVTGAPYSGERVSETVQTLADGTHITGTTQPTKEYRDSLGRTRTERSMFRGPVEKPRNVPEAPTIIEITDPVAQVRYTLDTQNKVAHRQALAPLATPARRPHTARATLSATSSGPATAADDAERPKSTTEKLEPQTIEGVQAEGTRHTTTWPVGAQGNDRPITMVTEDWWSPELRVSMLNKTNDPRSGEHTEKLINVSRAEPDPSLFQPPADYTIVDEKEDFTIKWGASPQ